MISDDTEHLCMTAQALCVSPASPKDFARALGWKMRWWLASAPAGIGLATLRATLKLWLGWSPHTSGVFSAGNGPAMRSTLLGAGLDDLKTLRDFVDASTRLTHSDPKAFYGALAVAVAAWCSRRKKNQFTAFMGSYQEALAQPIPTDLAELFQKLKTSLETKGTPSQFAIQLGLSRGVSGYIYHTVPVVLHAWLSRGTDFEEAIKEIIGCGGDTDSTAAILGAILGSGGGPTSIPPGWLNTMWEWPRTLNWMKRLSYSTQQALEIQTPQPYPRVNGFLVIPRNGIFLGAVLIHALRRMLPW